MIYGCSQTREVWFIDLIIMYQSANTRINYSISTCVYINDNYSYSRRQNKVSVPFALHGERSENGNITVEKTVSKTVVKRYLNGAKTVTRKTEAVKILRDRTRCPRGSRSIVCTSKAEEHSGATGKL